MLRLSVQELSVLTSPTDNAFPAIVLAPYQVTYVLAAIFSHITRRISKSRFPIIHDGGRRRLRILKFRNFTVLTVKRVKLCHHAKFLGDRLNGCRNMTIFSISQYGGRHDVGFVSFQNFDRVIVPKFVVIFQAVAEIWRFIHFSIWILNFRNFTCRSVQYSETASPSQISWRLIKPLHKYGDFSIFTDGGFSIFTDGGCPPSWICDVQV